MKKPYPDDVGSPDDRGLSVNRADELPTGEDGSGEAARNIVFQVYQGKKQVENLRVYAANQLMIRQREMMASEFEQYFASKGLPVEVQLSGADKTSINFLSSLLCRDSVDRITERTNLLSCLKEAGFKKAFLGDGDEAVWTYDLKNL